MKPPLVINQVSHYLLDFSLFAVFSMLNMYFYHAVALGSVECLMD